MSYGRRLVFAALLAGAGVHAAAPQPLPSWNDSPARNAIIGFVEKVTKEGLPAFVPPSERIAVFDNDGTLWPENPVPFQLAFALDELKRRLPEESPWKEDQMVQAALRGDLSALLADHYKGLFRIMELTGSGMTTIEFADRARQWITSADHPRFKRPYDQLAYQPMLELLSYLRANNFKTFIVSGGGADFMRAFSERVYGIPPEQIVGSSAPPLYELRDDEPVLVKTLEHLFIDDGPGKPAGIHQFIGRRPIACFGNSDGDRQMLEYTTIGNPHPSLGVIVHHTDGDREYSYDKSAKSSGKLVTALAEAPRRGWIVVDMKKDWSKVFAP